MYIHSDLIQFFALEMMKFIYQQQKYSYIYVLVDLQKYEW